MNIGKEILAAVSACVVLLTVAGCENDSPMVSLGIDDNYTIARMQKLTVTSEFEGEGYRWVLLGYGADRVLSTSRTLTFVAAQTGDYHIRFELLDGDDSLDFTFTVNVCEEEVAYSPYIARVLEYNPAPGQFINKMPWYDEGDTAEDMRRKAEEAISGTHNELISLGAYGGYVTFAFDHTVVNIEGENDIYIAGNAFYDEGMEEKKAGSCEPGIVMVSIDTNGNGLPDDEWFELAGSDYDSPDTVHGYRITYSAPDEGKAPVPDGRYLLDAEYIPWHDSLGASGYVAKNRENTNCYYPLWEERKALTFEGTRLKANGEDVFGNGSYYRLHSFAWGYVDNHPDSERELNSFDIGRAVDSNGMPVNLPGADFVRVYTAVNQYCGRIGETSTELSLARDLHVE